MINQELKNEIIGRSATIGLAIVMSVNVACVVLGYLIGQKIDFGHSIQLLQPVLLLIAIADIGAGFFIKPRLLSNSEIGKVGIDKVSLQKVVDKAAIVLAALSAAAPIYGLLGVFLGMEKRYLVGFVIVSLVGFSILRPRLRDLERFEQRLIQ